MKLITINTCRESGELRFRNMKVLTNKISAFSAGEILIDGIWFELTNAGDAARIQQLVLENPN